MLKVLIVEDDALIAYDLDVVVAEAGHVVVGPVASVREAKVLLQLCDAACLDVDVRDGKTFDLAKALKRLGTPFAFVTGSVPNEMPVELRGEMILQKPYSAAAIRRWLAGLEAGRADRLRAPLVLGAAAM